MEKSRQRATNVVNQLSVVKKWASWIDIGASEATSAPNNPIDGPPRRRPMRKTAPTVTVSSTAESTRPTR
jgi:hypothetical protein